MQPKLNYRQERGTNTLAGKLIPVKAISSVTPITSKSITKTPIGMRSHDLKRTDLLAFHVCTLGLLGEREYLVDCFGGNADNRPKLFPWASRSCARMLHILGTTDSR